MPINETQGRSFSRVLAGLLAVGLVGCESGASTLTAERPLHLEEHLDRVVIEGSEAPVEVPSNVEWRFDEVQPDWKAAVPWNPTVDPAEVTRTDDALRVTLTEGTGNLNGVPVGGIYVDLPDWRREDWAYVLVRARTSDDFRYMALDFNLRDGTGTATDFPWAFLFEGDAIQVVSDGTVHSYLVRADRSGRDWEGPWRQLGFWFGSDEPASIDILSVSVISKEAVFADAPAQVTSLARDEVYRRTLYSHAPGRLTYRVKVPEAARLDVGLGVLREDAPVTFSVQVGEGSAEPNTVLEKTVSDSETWDQQSVDLSPWAGRTVNLALAADAERSGTVALWAAPTLTGARATDKPNVIFYIIDAGGANYMSVYGYNRRTTPNMERLAGQGAVFEYAYSNSTWSKTSTPSFATSLQHSVLGGYRTDSDPIPDHATTMAERLHDAGYQTAILTSNPYAGTMSSMERGADALRDAGADPKSSTSTVELHHDFWNWRDAFPGEPYFVHFQTTDVHWPWKPAAPFAGSFVDPETRQQFYEWEQQLAAASGRRRPRWLGRLAYPDSAYEKTGIDKIRLYDVARGLYDETMSHQDYQLGQLVERLKATGEWQHTLLIVAADHGLDHGLGVFDSIPRWRPSFDPYVTRIPMIIVWPDRIAGGHRFSQPVSMIDMLPTILDLADLPAAEVAMGQSLAPLLLGQQGWEPRPVIFDEFYVDSKTGALEGLIEVIDGRWGASLSITADSKEQAQSDQPRRPRLLLFDLWNDPNCLHSLHEERPDLVEKYTAFLEGQWQAHLALAQRFTQSGESKPLTPEQLRTLRSLGYIN